MQGGGRTARLVMGYGLASSFVSNLVGPFFPIFLFGLARGSFLKTGLASQWLSDRSRRRGCSPGCPRRWGWPRTWR